VSGRFWFHGESGLAEESGDEIRLSSPAPPWTTSSGQVALGSAVLWLVDPLIKRGDLGQAIDVLCTRAAARARTARIMSLRGSR
jgi:hypothetical protein